MGRQATFSRKMEQCPGDESLASRRRPGWKALVCCVLLRGDGLNILQGLLHEIAHHGVHAAGLLVDGDLAIGSLATGVLHQGTKEVDLAAAAQVINYVIDEVQQVAESNSD